MNQEPTRMQELIRAARQKAKAEREAHHTRYPGNGREEGEWTADGGDDYTTAEAEEWVRKRTTELLQEATEPMKQALFSK